MSDEIVLTSGDLDEIAGISNKTLNSTMLERGVVNPGGGGGRGNHKTYGVIDALAIAYAIRYAEALGERNVHLGTDAGRYLQNIGLEAVESELAAGHTFVICPLMTTDGTGCIISGPLQLPNGVQLNIPDLAEVYAEVKAKVSEIRKRPAGNRRGRTTGLVVNTKHE